MRPARPMLRGMGAREQHLAPGRWSRHRHPCAYAALILEGGYHEFGDAGRFRVEAGDLVAHRPFEAHGNTIEAARSVVLNFALPDDHSLPAIFRPEDPDELIASIRRGTPLGAIAIAEDGMRAGDWPDLLAAELAARPIAIGEWAERHFMSRASVSRGFRQAYGVSPARFRLEHQARRALRAIRAGRETLAEIAQDHRFADQAHMSRSIRDLTGYPPSAWRPVKSVQDTAGLLE